VGDDCSRRRGAIFIAPRLSGRFDPSLLRRHLPFRSVRALRRAVSSPASIANSTHGVHQRFPSTDITSRVHSRTSRRPSFGALRAKQCTRSVLVVPPDSDGLLLPRLRRSVAPCSRSLGSPCFNPRVYDSRSYATVAGSPQRRMPFEAFPSQAAVTRHRVQCPPAVALESRPATILRWCGRQLGRSTSGPCSTCEAVANAPPLPVECCPLLPWASRSRVCLVRPAARQSYGHTQRQGKPFRWGTSRSPWANPGPAATVADGADRLCEAEPASRALRGASLAETADTSLRPCHPLCSCWRSCTRQNSLCTVGSQHPKAPSSAPTLRWVLSTQHTGNPLEESDVSANRVAAFLIGIGQAQRFFNFERPRG